MVNYPLLQLPDNEPAELMDQLITVAVIDDEPDITGELDMMLSRQGMSVHVSDGQAPALELFHDPAMSPEVVIMDRLLEQRDGLNLAGELREWCRRERLSCPALIMLTGVPTPAVCRRLVDLQFDAMLAKPVATSELVRHIRRIVARRRLVECFPGYRSELELLFRMSRPILAASPRLLDLADHPSLERAFLLAECELPERPAEE